MDIAKHFHLLWFIKKAEKWRKGKSGKVEL
jgi:hypothetical protein